MLHAIRAMECDGARRLMGAALALLLTFRLLLGPALLPPPEPGLVPICGGTAILYVALDGKAGDPGAKLSDPCPFFGFAAAPPEAGAPAPRPYLFRPGFAGRSGPMRDFKERIDQLRQRRGGLIVLTGEIVQALRRGEAGVDILALLSMSMALLFGETLAAAVVALALLALTIWLIYLARRLLGRLFGKRKVPPPA